MLPTQAIVPPEYQFYKRVLGLYPITGQFVLWGVARLHEETSATFAEAERGLPVTGRIVTYVPGAANTQVKEQDVETIVAGSVNNPLGIPEPGDDKLAYLFRLFAPILEIDTVSDADRIGRPYWGQAASS